MSQEENNQSSEQTTSAPEQVEGSTEPTLDHKAQLTDFLRSPAKYTYDQVMTELLLWHMDGKITETVYTNTLKIIESLHKAGKFATTSS
jgi:hypothetical protein